MKLESSALLTSSVYYQLSFPGYTSLCQTLPKSESLGFVVVF